MAGGGRRISFHISPGLMLSSWFCSSPRPDWPTGREDLPANPVLLSHYLEHLPFIPEMVRNMKDMEQILAIYVV